MAASDNHLRHLRRQLARQEAQLLAGIEEHFPPGIRLARPDGGYFSLARTAARIDTLRLHEEALAQGQHRTGADFRQARVLQLPAAQLGHPATPRQDDALATLGG